MTASIPEVPAGFVVECTGCLQPLAVRGDLAGRAVRCPECRATFLVPEPRLAVPAAASTGPSHILQPPPDPGGSEPIHAPLAAPTPPPLADAGSADLDDDPPSAAVPGLELAMEEPVKTLETATGTIVLRRLTPEEKARRRARRNIIMLVAGASILLLIVLLLGR